MRSLLLARRGENADMAETRLKIVNHRRQLSHLQSGLMGPLWPLHANTSQDCDRGSEQTTESSRKTPKLE